MKTIKIIDLLKRIANNEKVPKKIKYCGYEYWYEEDMEDYKNAQTNYRDYIINSKSHYSDWLNDEVEIIEEEKEIEGIETIDMSSPISVVHCAMKINELIDAVNELKRGN